MEGYTLKQLKGFKFEVIKDMFDKAFKRVNTFVDYKTELMEESLKKVKAEKESSSKRAGEEHESENLKKQKLDENVEAEVDDGTDGISKRYSSMIRMLQNIDKEDLETLWKLVKAKHELTRPEEAYERVL
ncbi:hypothetical protein Tco_0986361 [Tanacetum coccineum]